MAKKRLNKKVALIGTLVFLFLVLCAIGAVLYLNRDPDRFIQDGDAAVEAARKLVDEEERAEEYKRAESNYRQAHGLAETDSEKVRVLFRLADLYIETDQWPDVMKCWNGIVQIDPRDVRARFGRLKYMYIVGDSGLRGAWQEVVSQASELIGIAEEQDLFAAEIGQWDPFVSMGGIRGSEKLGPYLYLLRARGNVEIAKMGASPDPDGLLNRAMDDLKKVQELEPTNVEVHEHMAMAALAGGEILTSKGDYGARERAQAQARDYLEQGIKLSGDDPKLQIMVLSMRLSAARSSEASVIEDEIFSLEPEYTSLVEKYPSSAADF
jgi:tetratricopeptide (TPR) repeat protein